MRICKKIFLELFYGECYYRHRNKNEKNCPTCKLAELPDPTDKQTEKLGRHKMVMAAQVKAYDYDKQEQKRHPHRLFLVMDFTRLEGNGDNGGNTIQDLILWVYKYNIFTREYESEVHHYLPTKLQQKNDASFVGSVLDEFISERNSDHAVKEVLIWSDGGAAHFKQKFCLGMMLVKQRQFSVSFRWSFFASNHGHNACDGAASLVKRTQRKRYAISDETQRTPKEFADFIHKQVGKHVSHLVHVEQQTGGANKLDGVRSMHCFVFDHLTNQIFASVTSLTLQPSKVFDVTKWKVC